MHHWHIFGWFGDTAAAAIAIKSSQVESSASAAICMFKCSAAGAAAAAAAVTRLLPNSRNIQQTDTQSLEAQREGQVFSVRKLYHRRKKPPNYYEAAVAEAVIDVAPAPSAAAPAVMGFVFIAQPTALTQQGQEMGQSINSSSSSGWKSSSGN